MPIVLAARARRSACSTAADHQSCACRRSWHARRCTSSCIGVDLRLVPNARVAGRELDPPTSPAPVGPVPGALFTLGFPLADLVPARATSRSGGCSTPSARTTPRPSQPASTCAPCAIVAYGLGGLFAGFGGLALTALVQSANAEPSTQYALPAIAAVVLGGTSLWGGRGGLIGVVLGAFSIYLLQNLLVNFQVNPAWLQIIYGGILISAGHPGRADPRDGRAASVRMPSCTQRRRRRAPCAPSAAVGRGARGSRLAAGAAGCRGSPLLQRSRIQLLALAPCSSTARSRCPASTRGSASARSSCSPRSSGSPRAGRRC